MTPTKWLAVLCAIAITLAVVFFNYAIAATGCDYVRTYSDRGVVYVWAVDCTPEIIVCDNIERPGCTEAAGLHVPVRTNGLDKIR